MDNCEKKPQKYEKTSNKVTLKIIAERAGVSVSCVTRCINNSGYVSEKKRKIIQEIMEELNYTPNRYARMLRGQKSRLLAYIYCTTDENILFTKIATRVEKHSFEKGYSVLSFALSDTNKYMFKEIMDSLMSYGVDGLIFNIGDNTDVMMRVREIVKTIAVPVVMIERCGNIFDVEKVLIDNTEGSYVATIKLAESGHSKIGFLGVETNQKVEKERYLGYEQAMQEINPEYIYDHCYFSKDYTVECGYKRFGQILDDIQMQDENRPTAFLITSDILAAGAYRAAWERGVRIPEDISLIGYDDTIAAFMSPPLSTMQLPVEEISKAAVDTLIEKIENSSQYEGHRTMKIGPIFIERNSVKKLSAKGEI